MDTRYNQLVLLFKRVEKANEKINELLNQFGWTREQMKKWQRDRKQLITCPFDKRHLIPKKSIKEHYRRCLLKSRGIYNAAKIKSSDNSSLFFYKHAPSVVSFIAPQDQAKLSFLTDHEQAENIVDTELLAVNYNDSHPKDDYVKELERVHGGATEKRQLYDQVVQASKQKRRHRHKDDFLINEIERLVNENQKTRKNKLHEDRKLLDNKRKRNKYRVKMKSMTATDVQRQLIHAYMEEFDSKSSSFLLH